MRDPKRIDVILDYIRKDWKESPDLRLPQLIENIAWAADKKRQAGSKNPLARTAGMESWMYSMDDDFVIDAYRDKYPATGMLEIENKKELEE
jgi:hypothetical protein